MSRESLERFIQVVLETPELQEQLQAAPDLESVTRLAVELGEANGYSFTAEEVAQEMEEYAQRQDTPLSLPLENIVTPMTY
jgi:predicted ribosomally synthesized peptide with nif11-like leader